MTRPATRWRAGLVALCLLSCLLSACGGDRLANALLTSLPGHASPQGAVAGFFNAAAHKDPTGACGFVPPQERAACHRVSGLSAEVPSSGLRLGDTYRRGSVALVVLLGRVCLVASGHRNCLTNHDRRAGLPSSHLTYAQAVRHALTQADDPATLSLRFHGRWYASMFD